MKKTQLSLWVTWSILYLLWMSSPSTTLESVKYIQSPMGNFFIAFNQTISTSDADFIMPTKSDCQCRMQCFVRPSCKVWSTVWIDNTGAECRMSDVGPTNYFLLDQINASFFFREDTIDGEYFLMPDNLLYLRPNATMTFDESKTYCSKIPGHRLSIFKKVEQWNSMIQMFDDNEPYWIVDLWKAPNGSVFWGDDTPYDDTELGQARPVVNDSPASNNIYIVYNGGFNDGDASKIRRFLCQANPVGVEW